MRHVRGPLLTVDVGQRETTETDIEEVAAEFVGGRGVGTRLAYDRIPFDADPLGPENRLIVATGPLQTSNMSFTGRTSATALSPLTDGLCSSNAGGFLSRNVADTGNAAIEIVGSSDEPLAVHVTDDGVDFEAVPELEGAPSSAVTEYVETHRGLDSDSIACIGPAGENAVRFAAIMTTESRAFGRGGFGAVLGSKNVKLLTFSGDSPRSVELPAVEMDVHREAATSDHIMRRQGTTSLTDLANEIEALPTRYFRDQSFEAVESINGDRVESKKYKKGTCSACAFACKLPTRDEERGIETEGPEFETVMSFGSNAGVDDIVDVMQANDRCDELGLDTISCGDVVSAYLASQDAFGDAELVVELIEKIAHRDGIGDTLAEGIDRCHEELGVENWSMKGMEFAAHDGRRLNGQALSFATANRGADHLYGSMYALEYPLVDNDAALSPDGVEGKAAVLVEKENKNAVFDSAIACKFSRGTLTRERLATLLDTTVEALESIGGRIVDLERRFNNERGFDRSDDDALPYDIPGLEAELESYYEIRGWDSEGVVPPDTIA
ncbi:MAG: aldehyde ferredoxin oxidoreductase C-terminal domain-containing protein [Natronomonas sp.]